MACFTYHQSFPVQAAHGKYPVWNVVASLGVFSLDILEFSDVMNLEVACICQFVAAEFAFLRIEPIKYLVSGGYNYLDHSVSYFPFQRFFPFLDWVVEVGHGLGAFFRLVGDAEDFPCAGALLPFYIHAVVV